MQEKHWILWDGDCGLCKRAAAWFGRHDRAGQFVVMPFQEAPSPPMTPELMAACERAVHVVRSDGSILRAGRATLFILERTGWGWFAKMFAVPPIIWLVEGLYAIVARNRPFFAHFLFTRET